MSIFVPTAPKVTNQSLITLSTDIRQQTDDELQDEMEAKLMAELYAWNQEHVSEIPSIVSEFFPELLESHQIASSVPVELRGIVWMPSDSTTQTGVQIMAVDKAGFALVRCITLYTVEDVDHSTFSNVSLGVATELFKSHSECSPYREHEIGREPDYGPQSIAFDSPRG